MGTNEDDREKYDLYTEQVVLHPAKKYKWLIRIGKLLLFAVSVIIAASLFMVFLYPVLQKRIEEKNKDKNVIYIQKDNYILADNQTAEYSDILTEKDLKDNYEAAMAALRAKVEDVNKCVVAVDVEQPFSDVPTIESSQTEVAGLVVANVNSTYLVLTSSSLLEPGMNYIVRLSDEVQTEAAFVCRNTASGIGIVSINASKLTAEQRNSIAVAQLDNSYMVKQGDLVIASGKLYETSKGVSYGTIAGSKVEYSKDSGYEVFETSVSITAGGFAILFNSEGNVVGVDRSVRYDITLHAFMLSQSGIPVIYSGDEIGQVNDYSYKDDPDKAVDSRYLHRGEFNWSLAPNRNIADTVQGKLFHALDHLEHIRSSHSVFDTTADLRTIDTWDSSILAIVRENAEEKFIGIYNFSDQDKVAWINEDDGIYTDLISGHEMEAKGVMIPAFGCFWLCKKK